MKNQESRRHWSKELQIINLFHDFWAVTDSDKGWKIFLWIDYSIWNTIR